MPASHKEPLLVVEDSAADFRVLKRLMKKMDVQSPIYRCQTGDEVFELMYGTGRYSETVPDRPGIIMLDLNLPGMDGRAVLSALKQDEQFMSVPIIVFTCSSAPDDIEFCYQHGANGYMVKPINHQDLTRMLRSFVNYWLEANTSPFFLFS